MLNEAKSGELLTIDSHCDSDLHSNARKFGTKYEVETISLVDMLAKRNAPQQIDYLSIDAEGSGLDILEAFDFDGYQFSAITYEHSFTPHRDQIHALWTQNRYERRYEDVSKFEDWYEKPPA